jgi:hypothetical protein
MIYINGFGLRAGIYLWDLVNGFYGFICELVIYGIMGLFYGYEYIYGIVQWVFEFAFMGSWVCVCGFVIIIHGFDCLHS